MSSADGWYTRRTRTVSPCPVLYRAVTALKATMRVPTPKRKCSSCGHLLRAEHAAAHKRYGDSNVTTKGETGQVFRLVPKRVLQGFAQVRQQKVISSAVTGNPGSWGLCASASRRGLVLPKCNVYQELRHRRRSMIRCLCFWGDNWRRSILGLLPRAKSSVQLTPAISVQLQSKTDHFRGEFWQVSDGRTVESS